MHRHQLLRWINKPHARSWNNLSAQYENTAVYR